MQQRCVVSWIVCTRGSKPCDHLVNRWFRSSALHQKVLHHAQLPPSRSVQKTLLACLHKWILDGTLSDERPSAETIALNSSMSER
jgi:hypothetical protein